MQGALNLRMMDFLGALETFQLLVAQESIQERQQDFPLPTADSLPENEANLMDQDGPELQKGRPVLRATTIDEFLKENGQDVDLDGLCTEEHSFEQNSEEEDSMALNQNYYKYVMADIDEDEASYPCFPYSFMSAGTCMRILQLAHPSV
ncbi:hypothetical protein PIB30_086027 [Stylosanthes scabra]|uniref:Uncharacterized protein n=1 Tax=Stylosanthes scabra TaxID=79078 RepID=A0ABU6TSH5_9FABA|nr:hypothetical protein [Stylosanthes scabra]